MTHYSQWINSHARWLLRTSAVLLVCLPADAQQGNSSAPLTADAVMERVIAMNEVRAKALENYSSLRSYHLECHCLSHKKADMVVRAARRKNRSVFGEAVEWGVKDNIGCEEITMRLFFRLTLRALLLERGPMCHAYL